jgi:uncharacterized protein (DUF2141 family)
MRLSLKFLVTALLLSAVLCMGADQQGVGELTLQIVGMKNASGYVNISIADSEAGFLEKDKAYAQIRTRVTGAEVSVVLKGMPRRDYAVSVFHDENANGTLDKNMRGIPKEPYGFSNNARGKFGPPSYLVSRFTLQSDALTIKIMVQ